MYDFVVTYTNSTGNTFAETVALTVTNNSIADAGIAQTDQEVARSGRSSIQISVDSTGTTDFQFELDDSQFVTFCHRALKTLSNGMQALMVELVKSLQCLLTQQM